MSNTAALKALPPRLVSRFKDLGRKYGPQGVKLFVFGSQTRKDCRPNSDLDLGIECSRPVSPELFRNICKDVENLPTIRKVDLVDFSKVSPAWKKIAGRHRVLLFSK